MKLERHVAVLLGLSLHVSLCASDVDLLPFRGIPPNQEEYFKSAVDLRRFRCLQDSTTIALSGVNDDFCDCKDGSDELGTAACSHVVVDQKFWCKNVGHIGNFIHSSKVNDGICDCCDGSDEWKGFDSACGDECEAQAVLHRIKRRTRLTELSEGLKIYKQWARKGTKALDARRKEGVSLGPEVEVLQKKVEALREKEKSEKEAERAAAAAAQKEQAEKAAADDKTPTAAPPREVQLSETATAAVDAAEQGAVDDGKSDDDLVDGKSDDDLVDYNGNSLDGSNDVLLGEEEQGEEEELYDSDDEVHRDENISEFAKWMEDGEKDDHVENPASAHAGGVLSSWKHYVMSVPVFRRLLSFIGGFRSIYNAAPHGTGEKLSAAEKSLREKKERLTGIEKDKTINYGKDNQFYQLRDVCSSLTISSYTYEICFYQSSTQKEGHHNVNLGRFESLSEDGKVMTFSNGNKCWSGPARSLTVTMVCGTVNEIQSLEETQRCIYEATASTPAACDPEQIRREFGDHDEL